jgi:hypothetical protein
LRILQNVIEKSFKHWRVLPLVKINTRISDRPCILHHTKLIFLFCCRGWSGATSIMGSKLVQVLSVLCAVQYGKAARWSHSAMLSPDYRLLWSLGPGPQDITFELQVRTLGYVGFGFSKDGRMTGADIVVGWVDKGQVYFQVS